VLMLRGKLKEREEKKRRFGHDMAYLKVWRLGRKGKFFVDIWAWREY